ncbi:hypothetical protein DFH09DRAFT_225077 [Mycena vulgaris]|nr:hypothetical protein DFH09DRAFT_225077 [Mycena vulgaris]
MPREARESGKGAEICGKNAESWYRHINAPEGRGRQLMNGFLYLITGCEKSQSWGSASFQNVAPDFQLSFKPNANTNTGYNYRWRRGTPARTKQFMNPTPDQENLTNQTLFLHGFSISLGEGLWGKLFGDVSVEQITDSYLKNPHSTSVPFSSRGSSAFGVFGFLRGNSSGGRDNIDHHADDEVNISEIAATPNVFHPSRIINSYLAEKVPLATVVLTHDDDWGQVLRADDKESPIRNPSEWVQRILTDFTVTEEDGTIYLIRNAVTEAITDDNSALARQIGTAEGSRSIHYERYSHDKRSHRFQGDNPICR